jgi:hypothetical protein
MSDTTQTATNTYADSTESSNNRFDVLASQTDSPESAESKAFRPKIEECLQGTSIVIEDIQNTLKRIEVFGLTPMTNQVQVYLNKASSSIIRGTRISVKQSLNIGDYKRVVEFAKEVSDAKIATDAIFSSVISFAKANNKAAREASASTISVTKASEPATKASEPAPKASSPAPKALSPVIAASVELSAKQKSFVEALDEQFFGSETYIKGEHLHIIVSAAEKLGLVMGDFKAPKFLEGKKILISRKVDPSKPNKEYIRADNWLAIVATLAFEDDASASPEASAWSRTKVSADASADAPAKVFAKASAKIYFKDVYTLDELFANPELKESLIVYLVEKNQKYFKESAFLKDAIDLFQCGFYKENTSGSAMWERLLAEGFIKVNTYLNDGQPITFFDRPTYVLTQKARDMAPTKPLSVPVRTDCNRLFPALPKSTDTKVVNTSSIGVPKASVGGFSVSQSSSSKMGSPSPNESMQLQSLGTQVSESLEDLKLELQILLVKQQIAMIGGL